MRTLIIASTFFLLLAISGCDSNGVPLAADYQIRHYGYNRAGYAGASEARPAQSDICVDRGYQAGTSGYIDCWRYVNEVNQQNRAAEQTRNNALMNFGAQMMTPPQWGWCQNAWGQTFACRR